MNAYCSNVGLKVTSLTHLFSKQLKQHGSVSHTGLGLPSDHPACRKSRSTALSTGSWRSQSSGCGWLGSGGSWRGRTRPVQTCGCWTSGPPWCAACPLCHPHPDESICHEGATACDTGDREHVVKRSNHNCRAEIIIHLSESGSNVSVLWHTVETDSKQRLPYRCLAKKNSQPSNFFTFLHYNHKL